MGCGQKGFMQMWLFDVLARVSRQLCLSANKGIIEVKLGTVHGYLGIYLMSEENPENVS